MLMDEVAVLDYIKTEFADVELLMADGNAFIYYSPEHTIPDKTFPWATLVTNDLYDKYSDLDRPGVYRLNVGVGKTRFEQLFPQPGEPWDYKLQNRLMPHPEYGHLNWVCIVSPSKEQFDTAVAPLLKEAYETAVRNYERKADQKARST